MVLNERLRTLRESKRQSRADVQRSTGLPLAFIVSVEEGRTVPSLEVLEKWASALFVPLRRIFYNDNQAPRLQHLSARLTADQVATGKADKMTRDQKVKPSNPAARANTDSTQ